MTSSNNEENPEVTTSEHETITSPARISSLLKPLEHKIDLLVLTILNSDISYETTLLSVDADNNLLILDKLTPKEGHDLLMESRQPSIKISHKGADIIFTTTLNETIPEKIMQRYELIFPESIQYLHRRNTYRVTLRNNSEMSVDIQTSENKSYQGELHNISTEGMCIQFQKPIDVPQNEDSPEVQCVITLTDDQELKCWFRICHIYFHDPSKTFRIGGNFLHMDKSQKRAIEKLVVDLQRRAQKTMIR